MRRAWAAPSWVGTRTASVVEPVPVACRCCHPRTVGDRRASDFVGRASGVNVGPWNRLGCTRPFLSVSVFASRRRATLPGSLRGNRPHGPCTRTRSRVQDHELGRGRAHWRPVRRRAAARHGPGDRRAALPRPRQVPVRTASGVKVGPQSEGSAMITRPGGGNRGRPTRWAATTALTCSLVNGFVR